MPMGMLTLALEGDEKPGMGVPAASRAASGDCGGTATRSHDDASPAWLYTDAAVAFNVKLQFRAADVESRQIENAGSETAGEVTVDCGTEKREPGAEFHESAMPGGTTAA